MDKELKGNTFCPSNVVAITLPAPVEFSGMPLASNDDHQAVTGAGIGKGLVVSCEWVEGNGDGDLESRVCSHQWSSATMLHGSLHGMNRLLPKIPSIDCRAVR